MLEYRNTSDQAHKLEIRMNKIYIKLTCDTCNMCDACNMCGFKFDFTKDLSDAVCVWWFRFQRRGGREGNNMCGGLCFLAMVLKVFLCFIVVTLRKKN